MGPTIARDLSSIAQNTPGATRINGARSMGELQSWGHGPLVVGCKSLVFLDVIAVYYHYVYFYC